MDHAKETAIKIRKDLKTKLGYSSRQVSVKVQNAGYSSAIWINVKSLDIALKPIEELVEGSESYERDERTLEILAGGNTFVFVQYFWKLKYA